MMTLTETDGAGEPWSGMAASHGFAAKRLESPLAEARM